MYYHLRYTPYELSSENLASFCDKYERYIVAEENFKRDGITPTEKHYHCWIDSQRNMDSVRTAFKKAMGLPTGQRGVNNKYYSLEEYRNGENIDYIIKQNKIVASKNPPVDRVRVPPDPIEKKEIKNTSVAGPAPPKEKKEIGMWNQILEDAQFRFHREKIEISLEEALKIISRIYIKKMLPLPHPGDRKRWATSLVMYSKMGFDVESDPTLREKLIEEEALHFIGENMVKPVTNG